MTNGNKAVVGHHRVQETLSAAQEMVEEELGCTACIGDGSAVPLKIAQHLRGTHRREKYVKNRQLAQEEVHGRVKPSRGDNSQQDEQVPHNGEDVEGQKQDQEHSLQTLHVRDAQQDEFSHHREIPHLCQSVGLQKRTQVCKV